MRLFIALPVPEAVRKELRLLQKELRPHLPINAVRWTQPEQIHLTLRFLGNVSTEESEALVSAIRPVCARFARMTLRSERIGFFPHVRSPRVIWAWVHDDWGHLPRFQTALAGATVGFGDHREEKQFTAHLTIARVREIKPDQARALAEVATTSTSRVFGDWTAGGVTIMRSELSPTGSRYSELVQIPFAQLPA